MFTDEERNSTPRTGWDILRYLRLHAASNPADGGAQAALASAQRMADQLELAHMREALNRSSLGAPEVKVTLQQLRRQFAALPDGWWAVADLPRLLRIYQERRESWGEDHDTAVAYTLGEVDAELTYSELETQTYPRITCPPPNGKRQAEKK